MKFTAVFFSAFAAVAIAAPALNSFDARDDLALGERDFDAELLARADDDDGEFDLDDEDNELYGRAVASVLSALDEIPDDTLEAGPQAVNLWLKEHGLDTLPEDDDDNNDDNNDGNNDNGNENAKRGMTPVQRDMMERSADAIAARQFENYLIARAEMELATRGLVPKWLKCLWSIGSATPWGKLAKIKKIASKIGGLSKVAKAIAKCGRNKVCLIKNGGAGLKEIVDLITGYQDIKKNCF